MWATGGLALVVATVAAAWSAMADEERRQQRRDGPVVGDRPLRAETGHCLAGVEQLAQPLRVAGTGGGLGVVLREVQAVRQQERVDSRGRAGGVVPGVDAQQPFFRRRDAERRD
jgi:hypothetical protein